MDVLWQMATGLNTSEETMTTLKTMPAYTGKQWDWKPLYDGLRLAVMHKKSVQFPAIRLLFTKMRAARQTNLAGKKDQDLVINTRDIPNLGPTDEQLLEALHSAVRDKSSVVNGEAPRVHLHCDGTDPSWIASSHLTPRWRPPAAASARPFAGYQFAWVISSNASLS